MAHSSESAEAFNRIFVLGGKESSKRVFEEEFGKFGEVKDVWMVDDRKTGEFKGITYITYAKASEAALAIEELNGRTIGNSLKPLKVILANDKKDGNVRDPKEGERMMRIFIIVPRSSTEDDIKSVFEAYGKIEYVRLIKDRKTGSSKGLAYVKYFRAYHAAVALENCDSTYRAVFAVPPSNQKTDQKYDDYNSFYGDRPSDRYRPRMMETGGSHDSWAHREYGPPSSQGLLGGGAPAVPHMPAVHQPMQGFSPLSDLLKNYPSDGVASLEVMTAPGVSKQQLYALLDLTPGLEYCEVDRETNVAHVQYKTPQLAAYVKEKLNYVEYPPGFRLAVRYPQAAVSGLQEVTSTLSSSLQNIETRGGNVPENLESLVQSIKKATDILQRAGVGGLGQTGGGGASDEERVRYCSVPLPLPKPLAERDSPVAQRLFLVSQPEAFPQDYLQDVLCRFGGLIDAFFKPGKNFGYAKFASAESADHAIKTLHGQQVCHMRLKVMTAEPPKYSSGGSGDKDVEMQADTKRPRLT